MPPWAAGGKSWAIVTAWNPHGLRHPDSHNAEAARRLLLAWTSPSFPVVNGEEPWAEEALLLPGARLRDAVTLGRRFGQAAIVFGVGRRTALVWLDGDLHLTHAWAIPALPYTGSS